MITTMQTIVQRQGRAILSRLAAPVRASACPIFSSLHVPRVLQADIPCMRLSTAHKGGAPKVSAEPLLGGFCGTLAFPGINGGKSISPADLRGKVVLLVNTASYCGYTPQLKGLQALHAQYSGKGLVVLAVPSNDFGEQEPDPEAQVEKFYRETYGAQFTITAKQRVIGGDAHPAFTWLQSTLGDSGAPSWNFQKWLVGRDGELLGLIAPAMDPMDPQVVSAVEDALAAPAST